MNDSLVALFPDADFRFHLTLRRGTPSQFFGPVDPAGRLLAERADWLRRNPARYAAMLPEGEPLLEEFATMAADWVPSLVSDPEECTIEKIGRSMEPDILLLSPDNEGRFRLRGGALCFPTGWALEEKLGSTLDLIHDVVPGLNPSLGPAIHQFLAKLKPGAAYFRDNWGLAGTDELNLHPAREIPPISSPPNLNRTWLRVEHQALVALPRTAGVAFGIRIRLHRLSDLVGTPGAAGLSRALATMPADLAGYKRLLGIREEIVAALG